MYKHTVWMKKNYSRVPKIAQLKENSHIAELLQMIDSYVKDSRTFMSKLQTLFDALFQNSINVCNMYAN